MKPTGLLSHWLLLAYFALTFYCLGAALMNEFVEYQSWAELAPYLSATDFAAWHISTAQHTMPFLTLPAVLLSVVLVLLLWFRPANLPRPALYAVLACHVVVWLSTLLVQWPLESELSAGNVSQDLIDRLIRTDWVRKVMLFVEAPLALYLAHRALRPTPTPGPALSRSVPALG